LRSQTAQWLTKAREDFQAAQVLLAAGLTDTACFHAQQAAEKCLKALLEENQEHIPKTHDLNTLIDRFASRLVPSAAVVSAASMLTSFAVEIRYPGTDADIVDARDALNSATEIMDWTIAILDQMP